MKFVTGIIIINEILKAEEKWFPLEEIKSIGQGKYMGMYIHNM